MGPDQIPPAPFLPFLYPDNLVTKVSKELAKQPSLYGAEERIKKFRAQEKIVQCNLLLGVASMERFIQKRIKFSTEISHWKGPPELLSLVSCYCILSATKFIKIHLKVFSFFPPPHSRKMSQKPSALKV